MGTPGREEIVRRLMFTIAVATIGAAGFGSATLGPVRAIELSHALSEMYALVAMPPPANDRMIVCYAFGCKRRMMLDFTDADKKRLSEILATGRASPEAERKALAQAVVWFDRRVGPITGTSRRVAYANGISSTAAYNFDCFDTTRNTASLFLVLQDWGLLRHHVVGDPRYRGNIFLGQTPHNTAVVTERASRRDWAVDLWPHAYAEPPDVMPVEQWLSSR
jgi:hypothetical protein